MLGARLVVVARPRAIPSKKVAVPPTVWVGSQLGHWIQHETEGKQNCEGQPPDDGDRAGRNNHERRHCAMTAWDRMVSKRVTAHRSSRNNDDFFDGTMQRLKGRQQVNDTDVLRGFPLVLLHALPFPRKGWICQHGTEHAGSSSATGPR